MRCVSHLSVAIVVYLSALTLSAQGPTDTLDIYWIDVEGGAATLIVTPAQESVLMDAGWARSDDRDVLRIQAAMRNANVDRIDYFIASHFHGDHVGGLPALSASVDIGQFIDHGDPVGQDDARSKMLWDGYLNVSAGKRRTVAPGDKLRLRGVELTIVTAHGRILDRPLLPLGPNPFCEGAQSGQDDQGENSRSVGYLLSLGAFQFLNLGDLTPNVQHRLACPEHKLSGIDLYQVPHHGNGIAPQLTWALSPTVAVINNGPHKGGGAEGYDVIAQTPGIVQIYQTHRPLDVGAAHSTDAWALANLTDEDGCEGHWIKATVHPDGRSYFVGNGRNGRGRTCYSR